nr:hypothetical protein [Tanacetum cinerariifolium]
EFSGELAHTDLIPPGINEANCDLEEDIHLVERLLNDNSSPRPLEEPNSKNSDAIIESLPTSHIPVEDSDPFMEETDLFLALMDQYPRLDSLLEEFSGELAHTDLIPPGINEANCDLEEDIHLVERLLNDNSSPRPLEEPNSKNSDAIIESLPTSHIPVEDSDPFMEETDLFLALMDQYPR